MVNLIFVLQGETQGVFIKRWVSDFLYGHPVPFIIHNHPPIPKERLYKRLSKNLESISSIQKWCLEKFPSTCVPNPFPSPIGDFSDKMDTIGRTYIYTEEYGYIEYGKEEGPVDMEFKLGTKCQVNYDDGEEEFIIFDDGQLLGLGVSTFIPKSLYAFKTFVELIEKGAKKIKLISSTGKFAIWNPAIKLSSMLQNTQQDREQQAAYEAILSSA